MKKTMLWVGCCALLSFSVGVQADDVTDVNLDELQTKYESMTQEQLELTSMILDQVRSDKQSQTTNPMSMTDGARDKAQTKASSVNRPPMIKILPRDRGIRMAKAWYQEDEHKPYTNKYWDIKRKHEWYEVNEGYFGANAATQFREGVNEGSQNTFPW